MKKLMIIAFVLIAGQAVAQTALGEVIGEVIGKDGQPAYDARAWIDDNGRKYQARADFDGRFRISAIPSGLYQLNVLHQGDTLEPVWVEVPIDGFADAGKLEFVQTMTGVIASAKGKGVRLIDGNLPVASITAEEIDKSPAKFDIKGLITSMGSDVRQTSDGELVFRGARKGDMIYLIDGVKTRDVGSVPGVAIGRMQLYTGGLPAKYGDTLGGVVVMETKSYFDLYRRYEAQKLRGER